jgi:5-enolpyruvylshikimate-3-phosphate synthase
MDTLPLLVLTIMYLLFSFTLCDTPTQYNTGKAAQMVITCNEKKIFTKKYLIEPDVSVASFIVFIFSYANKNNQDAET